VADLHAVESGGSLAGSGTNVPVTPTQNMVILGQSQAQVNLKK